MKMDLKCVLARLNEIKKSGLIGDYAIGGGYAVMLYDVPLVTFDLDVFVILSSDEDFHKLYDHFRAQKARIENVYIYIEDMPVQFLPSYVSPLWRNAIEEANVIDFKGIRSKFISLEYLILLLLTSFRPKDRLRIQNLSSKANKRLLMSLMRGFDDEKKLLHERYKRVLAGEAES